MGDEKTGAEPRRVQRLTRDGSGVTTVNIRSSRLMVFWASYDALAPVDPGWYIHTASVEGRTSIVDGELRLGAPFDLKDPKVRWEHAKISRLATADLFLDVGRRYVFFITASESTRQDLLRDHLPWPSQLRSPKAKDEPAIIVFEAWSPDLDYHHESSEIRTKTQHDYQTFDSFDSWEHESIAEWKTRDGSSVQGMIDLWSIRGLIDGGAMVKTDGDFAKWEFRCPWGDPDATPTNPYNFPRGSDALDGTWHYVLPEKQRDPQSNADIRWTANALYHAILSGKAVALDIGQVIMLGGDLFGTPEELENPGIWKDPVGIMQVYWEARAWLDVRKKARAAKPDGYEWDGYQHKYGAAYLALELMLSTKGEKEASSTIIDMIKTGRGDAEGRVDGDVGTTRITASPPGDDRIGKVQRKILSSAFDILLVRAEKVDAMVEFLKEAGGPSHFSKIHFLSQILTLAAQGKGGTLQWMKSRMPWLAGVNLDSRLTAPPFTAAEISQYKNEGINDQLIQTVVTNGHYMDLALHNKTHFSENGENLKKFKEYHRQALDLVDHPDKNAVHPIPAKALLRTAFGCHFFTDAFSASHMRVPRSKLGAWTSKLMHDADGLVGLWVHNSEDTPKIWYAYGDTYLHAGKLSSKQRQFLPESWKGYPQADPNLNFEMAAAAVGSAFKQLHYQVYALWQNRSPILNPTLKFALISNGPMTVGVQESRWALEGYGNNASPAADPTTATYLRSETSGPGNAGPPQLTLLNRLGMTSDQRIAFLQTLAPIPLGPSLNAPQSPPEHSYDSVNIPPIFSSDGNLSDTTTYDIVTGADHAIRPDSYQGFSLRVNWGPFGDFLDDDDELRLNFDDYFYLNNFFKDVQGLQGLLEPKLLDVYEKLSKEHW
jgi:hypothetical protein